MYLFVFFFQAEDGIRDHCVDWSSDVCSSDLETLMNLQVDTTGGAFLRNAVERAGIFARTGIAAVGVRGEDREIGRASCRERVEISVVAGALKKKNKRRHD